MNTSKVWKLVFVGVLAVVSMSVFHELGLTIIGTLLLTGMVLSQKN